MSEGVEGGEGKLAWYTFYLAPTLHCFPHSRWRPERSMGMNNALAPAPPKSDCTAGSMDGGYQRSDRGTLCNIVQ